MSTKKPIVGITGDFRPERYNGAALSWFNAGYYDSILGAGGVPLLLPPYDTDEDLKQALEPLGGIVLAGCNLDLDPVRMGLHPGPAVRTMPRRREDFDRRIAQLAIDMKLPVLAIGSGMQLINVLCGGSLVQHIPEEASAPKVRLAFATLRPGNARAAELSIPCSFPKAMREPLSTFG